MIGEELPRSLLGTATDWIRDNMEPADIFPMEQLKALIGDVCMADEVFSAEDLHKWARENGYVKERVEASLYPGIDNGI